MLKKLGGGTGAAEEVVLPEDETSPEDVANAAEQESSSELTSPETSFTDEQIIPDETGVSEETTVALENASPEETTAATETADDAEQAEPESAQAQPLAAEPAAKESITSPESGSTAAEDGTAEAKEGAAETESAKEKAIPGSASYISTEFPAVLGAANVQGDPALSRENAVQALSDLGTLSSKIIQDIAEQLFVSPKEQPESVSGFARQRDGSSIDEISVKWITTDTIEDHDESLLHIKPQENAAQFVCLQISYVLSGEQAYAPGDVTITIPASVFSDKDGKPYGGTAIPYPQSPSDKEGFNWKKEGSSYIFTNTREMNAAARGYIQLAFTDIVPEQLSENQQSAAFNALIKVTAKEGDTIALRSNTIRVCFDNSDLPADPTEGQTEEDPVLMEAEAPSIGGDEFIKINRFRADIVSGGSYQNGDYVWTTGEEYSSGHPFIFRITYDISGTYSFAPGQIIMTVPKSILINRDGEAADKYEMSIPHRDDPDLKDNNLYVYYESGDNIIITNRVEVPAGQAGYIDVAYANSELTYNYYDYKATAAINEKGASNPFQAHLNIQQGSVSAQADTEELRVYINTIARITAVDKQTPSFNYSWSSFWGDEVKPENYGDYNYLVWPVKVYVESASQPYNLSFHDTFNGTDTLFLGYMDGYSGGFTPTLTVENIAGSYSYGRMFYVLTAHKKSTYDDKEYFSLRNYISVTLDPIDQVDGDSYASDDAIYTYEKPHFEHPTGHFYRWKWGLDKNGRHVEDSEDVRDYRLKEFLLGSEAGGIDAIDDLLYYTEAEGYPYPWTVGDANNDGKIDGLDAEMPEAYGMLPVTYELIDNRLNLGDPGNTYLQSGDYQIDSMTVNLDLTDAYYDSSSMTFKERYPAAAKETDTITIQVQKDGSSEYIDAAVWSQKELTYLSTNSEVVSRVFGTMLFFVDGITGYRLKATNSWYRTKLEAYPRITLFRTDNVLSQIQGLDKIRLNNHEYVNAYDHTDKRLVDFDCYGMQFISGVQKNGYMSKNFYTIANDVKNQLFTAKWGISAYERQEDPESGYSAYVKQTSGRFYDLLPKGASFKQGSLEVAADGTALMEGQYTYEVISNYNSTGREMLVIDIDTPADQYSFTYRSIHPWDTIKDFGKDLLNTAAYETGNSEIANGSPDDGGAVKEKTIMTDLDPDTDADKFLYTEASCSVDIPVSAAMGLYKMVRGLSDGYSYSDVTKQDADYSYRIRFSTDETSKAKNLILYDSIENYQVMNGENAGAVSDWHGFFRSIDLSAARGMGAAPVLYYSTVSNLDIEVHNSLDDPVWVKENEYSGTLDNVKAIAVDLRKMDSGADFILPANQGITFTIYMHSPKASAADKIDPISYNNIYLNQTGISKEGVESAEELIHQDFTRLIYRVTGDVPIKKVSSTDSRTPAPGATYTLYGTSDYGTPVEISLTTNSKGEITFKDVYRGTYTLAETATSADFFINERTYQVVIDGAGNIAIDGEALDGRYIVEDEPRIHNDLKFFKKGTVDGLEEIYVPAAGITFYLSGTSEYGNTYSEYCESGSGGYVHFDNLEMGTYTLEEVTGSDDFIMGTETFTVIVDAAGEISITNSETGELVDHDTAGPVIYNEPYHKLKIRKLDALNMGIALSGAKYQLAGTSDYGNQVAITATSDAHGVMEFTGIEPGTYVLTELEAPENYIAAADGITVNITSDGTVTGLPLYKDLTGGEGYDDCFAVTDERAYEGVITVTKVWDDDNGDRPFPVVHIGTTDPETKVTKSELVISKATSSIDYSSRKNIQGFDRANLASIDELPSNAVEVSNRDYSSEYDARTWVWIDNQGIMRWWSEADVVYLAQQYSNDSFQGFSGMKYVDFTGLRGEHLKSMQYMFYGCEGLKKVTFGNMDTSNVTSMECMFDQCKSLETVDFYNLDTENVTDMGQMFYQCSSLQNADLHTWDTSKVTDMEYMFSDCYNLKSLNVYGWDTSCVTAMYKMFYRCYVLEEIDLSSWTFNLTYLYRMFADCFSLKTVYASVHLPKNTGNNEFFQRDANIVTNFGTHSTGDYYHDWSVVRLDGYDDDYNYDPAYIGKGWLTYKPAPSSDEPVTTEGEATFSKAKVQSIAYTSIAFQKSSAASLEELQSIPGITLTRIDDESTKNVIYGYKLNNIYYWWSDADKVYLPKDSSAFFYNFGTNYLTKVDLTGIDASRVKNAIGFFGTKYSGGMNAQISVSTIIWGDCYFTSLEEASYMFCGVKPSSLDLTHVDLSKVKDLSYLFYNCGVSGIDLSHIDTASAVKMDYMLASCNNLEELDLTSLDMTNIESAGSMLSFGSSAKIKKITFTEDFNPNGLYVASLPSGIWQKEDTGVSYNEIYSFLNNPTAANAGTYIKDTDNSDVYAMLYDTGETDVIVIQRGNTPDPNYGTLKRASGYALTSSAWQLNPTPYPRNTVTKIVIKDKIAPTYALFSNMTVLEEIEGIENVDLSKMTSLYQMFCNCKKLKSLDLSSWDTSSITSFHQMFYNCNELEDLNVSGWDVSNAASMNQMFSGCSALKTLDLSGWDPIICTDVNNMFSGDTSLETIYASCNWNAAETAGAYMFTNCTSLSTDKGTAFTDANSSYARLDGYDNDLYEDDYYKGKGYFTAKEVVSKGIKEPPSLTDNEAAVKTWNRYNQAESFKRSLLTKEELPSSAVRIDTQENDNSIYTWYDEDMKTHYWWSDAETIYMPEDSSNAFKDYYYITDLDLTGLDFSRVKDFSHMFENCLVLEALDLSGMDTSSAADMSYMFYNCQKLSGIDMSGFDTSKVTNMEYMFGMCQSLEALDVSPLDTSNVINMRYMFCNCKKLPELDVSTMDTSSLVNAYGMFQNCSELAELDLSEWVTPKLMNISYMFAYCPALKRIYASSPLYISGKTIGTDSTFYGDNNLATDFGTTTQNLGTYGGYALIDRTWNAKDKCKIKGLLTYKAHSGSEDETGNGDIVQTSKSEMYEGNAEDSANVYEKWIDNDNGTWSYRFKVFDQDSRYYAWESEAPGYEWLEDALNAVKIDYMAGDKDAVAVITNHKTEEETGSISVTKKVTGAQATAEDRSKDFAFTVSIPGLANGKYGSVTFKDGTGSFTLKDKEIVYISGLHVGCTYTVTETDPGEDYNVTYSGQIGTIAADAISKVTVTNERKDWYGSLRIVKSIEDSDDAEDFTFTVTLTGTEISGAQRFGDYIFRDGICTVTVTSGTPVTITGLPIGTIYKVEENPTPEYILKDAETENAEGTIEANTTVTASFVNQKIELPDNGFTLKKSVKGKASDDKFGFSVILSGLLANKTYQLSDGTSYKASAKGSANVTVQLGNNEYVTFDGLPIGAQYQITEKENGYIASYTVTDTENLGLIAGKNGSNPSADSTLSTAKETVDEDEQVVVEFVNSVPSFPVPVTKSDLDHNMLAGAELEIRNSEDAVVYAWTSSRSEMYEAELIAGTYTLVETKAPAGYRTADPVTFEVHEDGSITSGDWTLSYVEITDKPVEVTISKVDENGGFVEGASLAVYADEDVLEDGTIADSAIPVISWTSTGEAKNLSGVLSEGKAYVLIELSAPYGYGKAAPVRFSVPGAGEGEASPVSMTDVYIAKDVVISKLDEDGNNLAKAKLSVIDAVSEVVVESFETTDDDKTLSLLPGKYVLHEDAVPNVKEYAFAEDIEFEITSEGKLLIGDQEAEKVVMVDVKAKYGDLEIVKTLITKERMSGRPDPATFVFSIEAELDGQFVYSDVVSMVFDGAATSDPIVIKDLPAGAEVTVTEVYSGGNYRVDGSNVRTAVVKAKAPEDTDYKPERVTFVNAYDSTWNGGGSAANHINADGTLDSFEARYDGE